MNTLPIILDIEASGLALRSYPIEIGYADARGNTWCALVHPQLEWIHWDPRAESLHQISRKTLLECGLAPKDIAQHLNEAFLNQVVYCDAWMNDFVWLSRLYDAADMRPHFRLEDLRLILTPAQADSWHQTKQRIYQTKPSVRHRASADAKLLQDTWLQTQANQAVLTSVI